MHRSSFFFLMERIMFIEWSILINNWSQSSKVIVKLAHVFDSNRSCWMEEIYSFEEDGPAVFQCTMHWNLTYFIFHTCNTEKMIGNYYAWCAAMLHRCYTRCDVCFHFDCIAVKLIIMSLVNISYSSFLRTVVVIIRQFKHTNIMVDFHCEIRDPLQ